MYIDIMIQRYQYTINMQALDDIFLTYTGFKSTIFLFAVNRPLGNIIMISIVICYTNTLIVFRPHLLSAKRKNHYLPMKLFGGVG